MIRAIAFDFDGVLAESVHVKTRAFVRLFAGEKPALCRRIIAYHLRHGGVSRFEKFRTIYRRILKRPLPAREFRALCRDFSDLVVEEVVASPWVAGAKSFLKKHRREYVYFLVSGTPDKELKTILRRRRMSHFFKAVHGSPAPKERLLPGLLQQFHLRPGEMVYVGDSGSDWQAARKNGIPFIWRLSPGTGRIPRPYRGPRLRSLQSLSRRLSSLTAGLRP